MQKSRARQRKVWASILRTLKLHLYGRMCSGRNPDNCGSHKKSLCWKKPTWSGSTNIIPIYIIPDVWQTLMHFFLIKGKFYQLLIAFFVSTFKRQNKLHTTWQSWTNPNFSLFPLFGNSKYTVFLLKLILLTFICVLSFSTHKTWYNNISND